MTAGRRPTPEILDLLGDRPPEVQTLALALRDLVLSEAPQAEEFLYSVYAKVIVFRFPNRKRGAFELVAAVPPTGRSAGRLRKKAPQ
jgi:hypothetical protein